MLYRIAALAAFLVSADALKIGAGLSRRAAVAKVASLAPLVPLAAFADLKKAGDATVYANADAGKLNAARAIERTKTGDLVDGSSATCDELDKLIKVDREAIEFEKEKIDARFGNDKDKVQAVEDKLQAQVDKLKKIRKDKNCASATANLKQATDAEVYKRADEGVLNSARVIERAKAGKLVDGSNATCGELKKLIAIDQKAVTFEKQKLEAMGDKASKADIATVAKAEKAIEAQITKLEKLAAGKC